MKLKDNYKCDICGKIEPWGKTWRRYSSILYDETCPDDMPHVCSEKCRKILDQKMATGEIKLPKLYNRHGQIHASVKRGKRGY